jgi:hypothetical protein
MTGKVTLQNLWNEYAPEKDTVRLVAVTLASWALAGIAAYIVTEGFGELSQGRLKTGFFNLGAGAMLVGGGLLLAHHVDRKMAPQWKDRRTVKVN